MEYYYGIPHPGPLPTKPPATSWVYPIYHTQPLYTTDYWPSYTYNYARGPYAQAFPSPPVRLSKNSAEITSAHNLIGSIRNELQELVQNFQFPDRLDFDKPSSDGQVPKLLNSRHNSSLNDYRASLEDLLDTLKRIRSRGDLSVRSVRDDAIKEVQDRLAELKRKKAEVWWQHRPPAVLVQPLRRPMWSNW
ncbi:BAG domain protein [Ceratobasidium sp. AG-Ba]|nr:BAG domain protein [Ceratobasidium sp. AG-Ba]QRW01405.1 BAG domain protein [Ceratobasidium sp. AG-Ba]